MSLDPNFLTPNQSAELAGVSLETLAKYEEIGLLSRVEREGSSYYREAEVRSLFYTRRNEPAAKRGAPFVLRMADEPVHQAPEPAGFASAQSEPAQAESIDPGPISLSQILSDQAGADRDPPQVERSQVESSPAIEPEVMPLEKQPPLEASFNSDTREEPRVAGTGEVRALRDQIEMLREERDWLRRRVEQLETRSEREQMLLLSENETVRRLVDRSSRPKWTLPFRLPWFEQTNQ